MRLLDTNVLIYAADESSAFCSWAREVISECVAGGGAAINAVILAELCVGDAEPETVSQRVRSWGIEVVDVPCEAANDCAKAYSEYRRRRVFQSALPAPTMPLPDFFIGAHAQYMGWELVTADQGRYRFYFPSLVLVTPR